MFIEGVCALVCSLWKIEEVAILTELELAGSCLTAQCEFWELNLGPLQEQQVEVLLTTEPPLQSLVINVLNSISLDTQNLYI